MIKRNMSLIVTNQFFTTIADSIFDITILWYVYQISGSALFASMVTAITATTGMIIGPVIGVFIDRTEPKSSMQIGYALMIIVGILLGFVYFYQFDFLMGIIYLVIIIQHICMIFIGPAKNKLLPRIVGESQIVKVNGYISSTSQTGVLIGQSISGFLIGIIGFVGVMLTHSAVYLLASILLKFVIDMKVTKESTNTMEEVAVSQSQVKRKFFRELKEGFKVLKSNRALFKLILLGMAVNVTTIAGSLLVVLVSDQYGASAIQFGFLNAMGAFAGIIIGLFAGKVVQRLKAHILYGSMFVISGIGFIGAGLSTNFYIGSGFLLVIVVTSIFINILYTSLLILLVTDEVRGRVFTLAGALSTLLMPPLAIIGGYLADLFHVTYLFIFAGFWVSLWGIIPFIDKDLKSIKSLASDNA